MQEYQVIVSNYKTEWRQNGLLHREDGPAIEWADGGKSWWLNGKRHREDGPAMDLSNHKEWWINGQRHREDGPAIIWGDGDKEWWLNGRQYTESKFLAKTQPVKELTVADIEKLLGHRVKVVK